MTSTGEGRSRSGPRTPAVRAAVLMVALGASVSARTSSAAQPENAEAESGVQLLAPLAETLDDSDWAEEHPHIDRALLNVWHRYGWNDEADLFARDVAREVSRIPPWKLAERLKLVTGRVGQRYAFSAEQRSTFQRALLRQAGGFLMRNAPTLLSTAREAFETRAGGRPFTPDQVARWADASQPVFHDARVTVERFVKELRPELDPRQRQLLDRDLKSYEKRRATMDRTLEEWAAGNWQPEHWGLQEDPIHAPLVRGAATSASSPTPSARSRRVTEKTRSVPLRWVEYDPQTWFAFVLDVQDRFALDPAQRSTAESIHEELLERATDYLDANDQVTSTVPESQRSTHEAFAHVRAAFQELRTRLEAIPTTAQREAASSPPSPRPANRRDPAD